MALSVKSKKKVNTVTVRIKKVFEVSMGTLQLVRMCRPGWLGKQVVNRVFSRVP